MANLANLEKIVEMNTETTQVNSAFSLADFANAVKRERLSEPGFHNYKVTKVVDNLGTAKPNIMLEGNLVEDDEETLIENTIYTIAIWLPKDASYQQYFVDALYAILAQNEDTRALQISELDKIVGQTICVNVSINNSNFPQYIFDLATISARQDAEEKAKRVTEE